MTTPKPIKNMEAKPIASELTATVPAIAAIMIVYYACKRVLIHARVLVVRREAFDCHHKQNNADDFNDCACIGNKPADY